MKKRAAERHERELSISINGRAANTLDVSHSGCGVELPVRIEPGSSVYGSITIEQKPYEFSGQIVWVRGGSRYNRAGIRFHRIENEFFGAIGS
jgi:hypothetical protein